MWILALLFWKRPRLAQNIVIGWLFLMGAELTVIAPGQLYIQGVDPTSPYLYPLPSFVLIVGSVVGPAAVVGAIAFLVARTRRDRNQLTTRSRRGQSHV